MRKPRLRTILVATGAAVALVAGSTAAYAAIASPVDGTGVIHGCYTTKALNGSHVFVLQDAGTNCPAGTTAISWNQQGQAGPTGAAGPAGPAGPIGTTGPQGPPGTSGTNGTNGTNIMTSQGAPTGSCAPGDSDIELTSGPTGNGEVWTCSSGATWNDTGTSIEGPTGPQGPQGPAGGSGPDCSAPGPGTNLAECQFPGSSALDGGDLTGANLTRANLTDTNLTFTTLIGANLAGADLAGANLTDANLTGANLAGATLTGATLFGAQVIGANVTDANLTNASITDAYVPESNFTGANLTDANLFDTYASENNFTGATLYGADTNGTTLTGSIWSSTTCPDGTNSDNDGGTCANNL